MKLFALALVPFACLASPAAAQSSLHETHERVWMPSGKAPALTWRMRDRPEGIAANHHQAGKGQMPVAARRPAAETSARREGDADRSSSD